MARPEPHLTWDADDSFEFIDHSELLHLPQDLDKIAAQPNTLNTPENGISMLETRKLVLFFLCCLIVFTLATMSLLHTELPGSRTEPVPVQQRRPTKYSGSTLSRAVLHGDFVYMNGTGFPIEEKKKEEEPEPTWPRIFPEGDSDACPNLLEWYHMDWICDGMDDCVGGFDEKGCEKRKNKVYIRYPGMKRLEESERTRIVTMLEESVFPDRAHRAHVASFLAQMRECSKYWWTDSDNNLYSKNITTGATSRFRPFRALMHTKTFDQAWHYAVVKKVRFHWSWTWIEEKSGDASVQQDFVPVGCPRCLESSELRSQYQECVELGWTCRSCDEYTWSTMSEAINPLFVWREEPDEHQIRELVKREQLMYAYSDKEFEEERRLIGEREKTKIIDAENNELAAKLDLIEKKNGELEAKINEQKEQIVRLQQIIVDSLVV